MSRKEDYIPGNDLALVAWMSIFLDGLSDNLDTFGLTPDDVAPLQSIASEFEGALSEYRNARTLAASTGARKNTLRKALEAGVRPLAVRINNDTRMTNGIRGSLGLNEYKEGRSRRGVGNEVPGISVEAMNGAVIVHFGSNPSNEALNGKPAWARGCNIYRNRAGEDELKLVNFEIASPYIDPIDGPAAHYSYCVRYRGAKASDIGGPSSSATIVCGGAMAA